MSPPAPAVIKNPSPSQVLEVQSKLKGGAVRFDEVSINDLLTIYPEEIHDAMRWFAKFIREQCGRNLSMAAHKCAQIKFKVDGSYLHKIFTGSYFIPDTRHGVKDDKHIGTVKLVGSVKKFLELVSALQANYRVDVTGRLPFVHTDTTQQIIDYIDSRRMPERVCKFGIILGPTGRQKSATARYFATKHEECVHVECPATPSLSQLISDLAAWFGVPRDSNMNRKMQAIIKAVGQKHIIIIDNVQRLYSKKGKSIQPIFSWLQKLQDDTNCTVILIDVPEFKKDLLLHRDAGYFERAVRRSRRWRR